MFLWFHTNCTCLYVTVVCINLIEVNIYMFNICLLFLHCLHVYVCFCLHRVTLLSQWTLDLNDCFLKYAISPPLRWWNKALKLPKYFLPSKLKLPEICFFFLYFFCWTMQSSLCIFNHSLLTDSRSFFFFLFLV